MVGVRTVRLTGFLHGARDLRLGITLSDPVVRAGRCDGSQPDHDRQKDAFAVILIVDSCPLNKGHLKAISDALLGLPVTSSALRDRKPRDDVPAASHAVPKANSATRSQ